MMSTKNATLYDTDFYAWANEQAALLRAGRLAEADIENIAEEIESMGRSEKRELISRLSLLFSHLLKWRHQPARRSKSWRETIEEQRNQIIDHLNENPSLRSQLVDAARKAYRAGRTNASAETGIDRDDFPADCPFSFDEAMDQDFWPD
jgi:hypothetical protein